MRPGEEDIVDEIRRVPLEGFALLAYAILKLAQEQQNTAFHLKYLGNGDAATSMGAIEAFGMHIGEKLDRLAEAIESIGGER